MGFRRGPAVSAAVTVPFLLAGAGNAMARCSIHAADSIVTSRYAECSPQRLVSFLHNNIVTPYSFQCAKKVQETCQAEGCDRVATAEAKARCDGRYVDVLSHCEDELDGAALMAKCKDTHSWPVAAVPPTEPAEERALAKAPDARAPSSGEAPSILPLDLPEVIVPAQTAKSSRTGNPRFRR